MLIRSSNSNLNAANLLAKKIKQKKNANKKLGKNCDLTRIRTQEIRTEVQCANHYTAWELTFGLEIAVYKQYFHNSGAECKQY